MLNSKAAEILRTFSQDELKSFKSYIVSPFHNTNKNVMKLFELSRKYSPEFDSPMLSKEKLFKKLYPGKKYSDIVMRILLSDLLRLAEEFLAYNGYSKNPVEEKKYLLEELKNRGLDSLFSKHVKEIDKTYSEEGRINSRYFLDLADLEEIKINFLISRDRQGESASNISKKSEYLVNFLLINLLNSVDEINVLKEVLNEQFEFNPGEELLKDLDLEKYMAFLKRMEYKYLPVIDIYYNMVRTSNEPGNEKYFDNLKSLIIDNFDKFSSDEQFNLFVILEGSFVSQQKRGKDVRKEMLEMYKLMLSRNIFSSGNHIQINLFRNIFYTALQCKEFKWAEDFISRYFERLVPEQQADMLNYSRAMLHYEKKNFEQALEHISKINYTFFIYKFDAKAITLRIYYEMKAFDPALSLMDSFAHFLNKNKNVAEYYKESFMSFIRFMKNLIRLAQADDNKNISSDAARLKDTVGKDTNTMYKKWLIEKATELEK